MNGEVIFNKICTTESSEFARVSFANGCRPSGAGTTEPLPNILPKSNFVRLHGWASRLHDIHDLYTCYVVPRRRQKISRTRRRCGGRAGGAVLLPFNKRSRRNPFDPRDGKRRVRPWTTLRRAPGYYIVVQIFFQFNRK